MPKGMNLKVAILIPTMNRSEFLIRQLRYYASVKSQHPVYIGDASNQEHRERTEKAVDDLQAQITIHYNHWPKLNVLKTQDRLGDVAKADYCAYTGDDDFLIPDSLSKCADFLEKNLEFRTAQGRGILFTLKNDYGAYGALKALGPYGKNNELLQSTATERILHFGQNYWVPQFSVHRRSEYIEDSLDHRKINDRSFGELLHNFCFISKGKSKFIEGLYLIRQGHDARYKLPNILDWIMNPNWQPSFQLFLDCISRSITKVDGVSSDDANELVRQSFRSYLEGAFRKFYKTDHFQKIIRDWIRNFRVIKKTVKSARIVRSKFTAKSGELSLQALLNPASPYHNDFVPVYNAITKNYEQLS